jgi:two-component system, cell cycle sensor histidine kinase and response regulator CckA
MSDVMPLQNGLKSANQIVFEFMKDTTSPATFLGSEPLSFDAAANAKHIRYLPVVSVVAAAGAVIMAVVASRAAEPLLLTVLATLAMLGLFLIFGLLAGNIRIGERIERDDLIAAFAETFDAGLLLTSRKGSLHYANAKAADILGRAPGGEPLPIEVALSAAPASSEALFRLTRAAAQNQPWQEDFELAQPGRPSQLMRVMCRPVVLPSRQRTVEPMVAWSLFDITEQRAKEIAALTRLDSALSLYQGAPVGFVFADQTGVIRHANETFLNWTGRSGQPTTGRLRLSDFLPVESVQSVQTATLANPLEAQSFDYDVSAADGRLLAMRLIVRRDRDGGLAIAAINRGTSAMLAGEEGAEMRFARLFQSAPFGIAAVDAAGRITSANGAFNRMTLEGAGGLGDHALDVLTYSAEAQTKKEFEEALRRAIGGHSNPAPLDVTTGVDNQISRRIYISSLAQGRTEREAAIVFVLDATEQKSLEAKFAQSSKMEAVGQLAGGIAHDFNNVLTAIIGHADMLLQMHRPSDPAHKDIRSIQTSALRAADMVRQLLSFSRRQPLQAEPLQLGELLTDTMDMLRTSVGEKVELKTEPSRDLWYVNADPRELTRVIVNLAGNASHAMPSGGRLTIRTSNVTERQSQKLGHHGMTTGEYVLIEVEDTGTGMSADVRAKIFEPFFTTKAVGKGTGLGLSNVYGIVKQSGGFIYCNSELGHGTTFLIYLPRYIPESEGALIAIKVREKDKKKKEKSADLTGTGRVLLVEDEDDVRSISVRALKRQGYEVLEASSGLEALEVVASSPGPIDIIVSDVVMPEMDGPTMAKELRLQYPDVKIIFVSGFPREAFDGTLDKDQQFAFLPKPFTLPQLAAKVKETLQGA